MIVYSLKCVVEREVRKEVRYTRTPNGICGFVLLDPRAWQLQLRAIRGSTSTRQDRQRGLPCWPLSIPTYESKKYGIDVRIETPIERYA